MKRGGYLKRNAPLDRHGPLKQHAISLRRSMLPLINRERKAKRLAEQFGPQAQRCRELPCCICFAPPPSDPAHVRSRGAGGRDRENVVPLCRSHHCEQHQVGILTFQKRHGIDLQATANKIAAQLEAEGVTWE